MQNIMGGTTARHCNCSHQTRSVLYRIGLGLRRVYADEEKEEGEGGEVVAS
jgi:hypothetical protein